MGNDAALAVLSDRPQLLYNYFKQLFAQVTNPPVDCIREEIIMSMETTIGPEYNLLEPTPRVGPADQAEVADPARTRSWTSCGSSTARPPAASSRSRCRSSSRPTEGAAGLEQAHERAVPRRPARPSPTGYDFIILSDRGIDTEHAPIPALLAVAGVHHHLIREGTRTQVGLVLESGEPREVHHFALLIGYGAGAINPYLAFETLDDMIRQGDAATASTHDEGDQELRQGDRQGRREGDVQDGHLDGRRATAAPRSSRRSASTRTSIDKYFTWTAVARRRHRPGRDRRRGRRRGTTRASPTGRSTATRSTSAATTSTAARASTTCSTRRRSTSCSTPAAPATTRSSRNTASWSTTRRSGSARCAACSSSSSAEQPIPIEEVESVEAIMKRFKSGAMSYGSISQEAHETLAIAMNRIGGKSNTGEGGEDPARYTWTDANGDSKNSAIKQVASGRFGVTSEYLVNAKELQIKMAQGAKPGEGGQLPGHKVYPWIAKVRHSTPGVGLISPPPHHDIYSIEDLAELIHDLKNANRTARISVKLVAEVGVGTVAAGVAKAHADVVLISGHDGGTGASPLTSIKHAGAPWELGLAETQQTLVLNDLRSRIVVEVDGQLKTGRDVVIGALLGAEEFGFATAPLVALGCIMMRVCHLNTCPVGVATQDPKLRKKFTGDAGARRQLHALHRPGSARADGPARLPHARRDGRPQRAAGDVRRPSTTTRRKGLDFSPIFYQPTVGADGGPLLHAARRTTAWTKSLDMTRRCCRCASRPWSAASRSRRRCRSATSTASSARSLGSEMTRRYGAGGPAGRHDPAALQGLGRPELRRVRAARHDADAGRRRQRLRRQGAVRRQDHRLPAGRARRSSPRRTSSSATSPSTARPAARRTSAAWPASASASATAASTRSCRRSATTAAST